MDKLLSIKFWILLLMFSLLILGSDAIRTPDRCGQTETFELRYAADLTSDIERFSTGYQGALWNIYYVRNDRYKLKVNFIFPNKPEDNVNITTIVRTSTDKSTCDTGKEDFGIIRFKCGPKPTSQHLKGVELQLISLKPFTKEHSGFTIMFQTHDFWSDTIIHNECSVENVRVQDCMNINRINEHVADSHSLAITATSGTSGQFDSKGKVTCGKNNYYPVYKDAFKNSSKCLPNARWEDEDDIRCWGSPDVTVYGNTQVEVGKENTFHCNFTVSDPPVEQVTYTYTNGESKENKTYGTLGTTLTSPAPVYVRNAAEVNGKQTIECSVSTNLTRLPQLNRLGRSEIQLQELYAPRLVDNEKPMNCTFDLGNSAQLCKYVFGSNPKVTVATLQKVGSDKEIDVLKDLKTETTSGVQSFSFTNTQLEKSDSGEWKLRVSSSRYPDKYLNISFYVSIVDSGLSGGAIAGIIIAVLAVVGGAGFAAYRFRFVKNTSPTGYASPSSKPTEL